MLLFKPIHFQTFTAVILKEDDLYVAECPEIGTVSQGSTIDEALAIKNTDIVKELALPPVKIHCSVLAEDAIRAAVGDWKKKQAAGVPVAKAVEAEA